jgi:hypothetical protein
MQVMSINMSDSDISGNLGGKKEAIKESELSNGTGNASNSGQANQGVKSGNLFGGKK